MAARRAHFPRLLVFIGFFASAFAGEYAAAQQGGPNFKVGNTDAVSVHMRKGPSNRSTVIAYVPPSTVVAGAGQCTDRWCKVTFKENEGWRFRRYLAETAEPATPPFGAAEAATQPAPGLLKVAPDAPQAGIPVQELPGDGMPVIGTIPADAGGIADLKQCLLAWCRVRLGNLEGWVPAGTLVREDGQPFEPTETGGLAEALARAERDRRAPTDAEPERTAALPQSAGTEKPSLGRPGTYNLAGVAAGGTLSLRGEPSETSVIVGSVPFDASNIEGMKQCVKKWCLVRYRGVTGFILRRHLVRADTQPNLRYRVDGVAFDAAVEVFAFPGPDAEVVGSIPPFATGLVPIGNCDRAWCHIRYFGVVGWVNTRFLVQEEPTGAAN